MTRASPTDLSVICENFPAKRIVSAPGSRHVEQPALQGGQSHSVSVRQVQIP